ncbi:MAG: hypothetical protein A3J66_01755 [Candidatus Magasanikbacteria bacterium RIFCSPHIGHO2_02_FULL_47_14]|uniref:DDH domain-containing protein n=1 Tax=Candidatus Magasanikbacteria bacterium RIFCSPHIGHO2_02_FULL_47_14 TaxID=1798680 RepID=A0A1F6M8G5_9BACT|nr:MAG: hypothetical protein A3J66_01755 [Candidatus Magasanikbacteria bacterium RIFCSPHIGHO2_02_FULL_47_14]
MAFTQVEQLTKLIGDAKQILVTFRKDGRGDAVASACAIKDLLQKQGKYVDIVVDEFTVPKKFSFLPHANSIKSAVPHLQKFIISVDIEKTQVQELSYDTKDNKLHIFITPKHGAITKDDIRTTQSDFRYDLIIILDTPDLASLGALYENNTELFYSIPVINIDHHADNEHFGQINYIDLMQSSTAEILAHIFLETYREHLTTQTATILLAGMIAATRSFKTSHIKPQTLTLASDLVAMGADREAIIEKLYRTKTLSALKLWGQALAHLQYDKDIGLVSTTITRDDFQRSGATEDELYDMLDELLSNSPEASLSLLLHEHPGVGENMIHVILYSPDKKLNAKQLLSSFKAKGDPGQANCIFREKTLVEVTDLVVSEIKKKLAENK